MNHSIYLDDAEIQSLITCPKVFRSKPRDLASVNKNYSQRFSVFSVDDEIEFPVFITYSQMQPQDFSIGLMYRDHLLFRVNGFHGTTRSGFYSAEHHARPHTHTLTLQDINAGRKGKPTHITDTTGEYMDLLTARLYFFKHCGIINYSKYFPEGEQLSFFDQ